jgi:hypothetical protein
MGKIQIQDLIFENLVSVSVSGSGILKTLDPGLKKLDLGS